MIGDIFRRAPQPGRMADRMPWEREIPNVAPSQRCHHRLGVRTAKQAIDADLDRLALRRWWQRHRAELASHVAVAPLRPQVPWLWPVLSRRYADQWRYSPEPAAILCCEAWTEYHLRPAQALLPTLIRTGSSKYDLVRAACVLLGRSSDPAIQDRLIELVGSSSDVVSYNARFSLGYAADPRILGSSRAAPSNCRMNIPSAVIAGVTSRRGW